MPKTNSEAYPYPILTNEEQGDFVESFFRSDVALDISDEEADEQPLLLLKYKLDLSNNEIQKLIDEGDADFCFLIKSRATGYRELFFTKGAKIGELLLPLHDVYQRVEIEAKIIITAENVTFSSNDLNEEFKHDDGVDPIFELSYGDPIAFSDIIIKVVSFEPLTLQSLLRVNLNAELNPNVYSVDTSSNEYLSINMGKNFKEKWDDGESRKFLISGVIKDAILISLKEFILNREDVLSKRWASLVVEKFVEIEDDLQNYKDDLDKLNEIALEIAAKYTIAKMEQVEEI
jgi:hypothetical protein